MIVQGSGQVPGVFTPVHPVPLHVLQRQQPATPNPPQQGQGTGGVATGT